MLEIVGLKVNYGPIEAVRSVNMEIRSGEAVGLMGANGAGKTSTLRAISGLTPSMGTIRFDGREVAGRQPDAIARAGLIHVPEGRHVIPSLTVHENLEVGLTARGDRRDGYAIDDVYDLFPMLVPLRSRGGWMLSGGEQQMLAIGRALVANPKLLMLDEPSLGLAPIIVDVVFQALSQVKGRTSVFIVEQNTERALQLCSRAYVLREGAVALEGAAQDLAGNRALIDTYLGTALDPK